MPDPKREVLSFEDLPYEIQRQESSGEWKKLGELIIGRSGAYWALEELKNKKEFEGVRLRVVPKNEADKYREGLAAGRALGPEEDEDDRSYRRPLRFMPENV